MNYTPSALGVNYTPLLFPFLHLLSKVTWGNGKSLGLEVKSLWPPWASVFLPVKWGQSYPSQLTGCFKSQMRRFKSKCFVKEKANCRWKLLLLVSLRTTQWISSFPSFSVEFLNTVLRIQGSCFMFWPWKSTLPCIPSSRSSFIGTYVAHHNQPCDYSEINDTPVWV